CDGQSLSWGQIINLYEWYLGMERDVIGLTMGHHLTEVHINLNPRSRMRVYLAVQVLSATVVNMLDEQNLHTTKSLRVFISHMNRFFDCLNVSKSDEKSNNLDKHKYRGADDERFGWLVTTFLKHLNDSETHCYIIPKLNNQNYVSVTKHWKDFE
uniref:Transposable element P transposase-like GTP-binding insertion domain-containing protein n=1 Tax=Clytia hemisphaerica TaxID=252671 RepID=A0A7M5WRG9_9CNID